MKQLLKIEEVAILIGVSSKTINNWYAFQRAEPDNEYAKLLPNYIQLGNRQTRLWDKSDIPALVNFKNTVPKGCKGVMGTITQKYLRK